MASVIIVRATEAKTNSIEEMCFTRTLDSHNRLHYSNLLIKGDGLTVIKD